MNTKKNPEITMSSSKPKEKNVNFRVLHGYTKVLNPYLNNVKKPRCQTSSAFSSNFMGNRRKNNTLPVGNVLHLDENSSAGSSTGSGSSNLMSNVLDDLSEGFLSIKDVDTNLIPTLLVSDNDQIDLSNLESISTINLPADCKYDSTSLSSLKLTNMDGTMLSDLAVADLTNNLSMQSQGSLLAGLVTPESSSETAQSFEAVDSNSIPLLSLKENQNDSFDNYNLLDMLENTTIPNNETFEDKLTVADDSHSNENTSLKRKRQTRTRKPRKRKTTNDSSVVQEDQNIDSSSLPQEDPTLKKEKKRRNTKGTRAKRSTRNKNSVDSSKVEETNVTVFKAINNDLEYDLSKVKAETNEVKSDTPVLHLDSSENKIETAVIEEIEAIGDFLTCDSEMIDLKPEIDPFGNIPETDPFGNCNDYDPLGSPEPCLMSPNPVVKNEDISCEMDNTVNVSVNTIGESLGKILEKLQKCDTVVLKKTDDLSNLLSTVATMPHVKDENMDNEVIINPNDSSNQIILSTEKSKCDTQNETNFQSEKLVVMDNIFSKLEKCSTALNKTPMSSDTDVFSDVKRKKAKIEKIPPNPDKSTLARTRKKNSASDKSYPVLRVKKLCKISLKKLSIPIGVTTVKVKKVRNKFEWTPLRPLSEEKLETIGNLPMMAEPSHCKQIDNNLVTEPMFSDSEDDLQILGSDNNIDGSELFSDEQSDSEDMPLITTDIDKLAQSIVCTDEARELGKKSNFKKILPKQSWSTSSPSTNKKAGTLPFHNKSVSFNQNSQKKVLMKSCPTTTRTNAFNKPYNPINMAVNKRQKYRNWSQDDMEKALQACRNEGSSIKKASKDFSIPEKTLADRLKGKVKDNCKGGGKPTALSAEHEKSLCDYVDYMAQRGFPLTVNQIMMYAWCIDKTSGRCVFGVDGPAYKWWLGFKKRHPEIAVLRKPDSLDQGRALHATVDNLRAYFQLLKKTFDEEDFYSRPQDIYNCDETTIDLNKCTQKLVVPKRYKSAHSRQVASSEHISLHCCASASGAAMPPFVIYKSSFPGGQYTNGGPVGALYGKQDSGFMDSKLFCHWFDQIFLKHARPTATRSVLLLLDGHASHSSPELIERARETNVVLLALMPHSTHLCQPLDVAVYKSLKNSLSKVVKLGQALRGDFWVQKTQVARIIKLPFETSMSMVNIKSGFHKCGIYPYDPNAIDKGPLMRNRIIPSLDVDLSIPPEKIPPTADTEAVDQ